MDQYQIAAGTEVFSADGEKLGKVVAVDQGYLVVEKGFLFPSENYVPTSAVASYDGNAAYLSVSKEVALSSGWDRRSTEVTTATSTDTTMTGNVDYTGAERTNLTDQDRLVVPVHEEELVATKRAREAGEVQITKNVVEEARTIEVPITEERVQVTRRVVDRVGEAGEAAFREETIEVPLTTEEVDLQKRVRVAEEIEIDKKAVQTTQAVQGTVRKEIVDVDETGTSSAVTTDSKRRRKKS